MRRIWPSQLQTPHVDLAIPVADAVAVLEATGATVDEEYDGDERAFRVSLPGFEMAIYDVNGKVSVVWYNDPAGRLTAFGRRRKVRLYMDRYTESGDWERRLGNAWMDYFWNDEDSVQLVYGIDKDVIRINSLRNRVDRGV